ncbi:hypothetical protein MGYG_05781 [Nannizzia gypsea CBS 118893]|uniref:BTB domain-containing protein n=1 Tax=Arthroderma gypseum (strain ATCC MYA-4604 / CBS 118893) TaxID=535722 RepID=E4UXV0_ARTGP|nr:hypothetical protein MGYG_05781 [Nannizzia gypsea CBS 118893]EFR02782.1 hypothetical protein MGYG_05781 [Nannizzia gypsea CBS 118893]
MAEETAAIVEPPIIDYNQPQLSPYQSRVILLTIGSKEYSIQEDFLRVHELLDYRSIGVELTLPDVEEDIGHTIIHFLYTGKYETLGAEPMDGLNITKEMQRSIQAYCAAKIYGLTGLETLAKVNIKQFSESSSIFDILHGARSIFSKLPKGEAWLPWYINTRLSIEYERDENVFKSEEFYDLFGENKDFDKAVFKMVVDIYSSRLSSLRPNVKRVNGTGAEHAAAEESPTAEELLAEELPAEELLAEEPLAEEPLAEDSPAAKDTVSGKEFGWCFSTD